MTLVRVEQEPLVLIVFREEENESLWCNRREHLGVCRTGLQGTAATAELGCMLSHVALMVASTRASLQRETVASLRQFLWKKIASVSLGTDE